MVGVATFGLSVVALGYLSVLVKMLTCIRWPKNTTHLLHHVTCKDLAHKLGKSLVEAADRQLSSWVTSSTMQLAFSLTREESLARKRINLLMKLGDLALETLLLYQMLESGSPTVLIGIFTFVAASNALVCAAMMFVPCERAPLAETFIDILFDFLIIIGSPMLVVVYCL
ncbi:hypothetical protein PR001_g9890 [Phytophthora rubi]|uniref:Uncharacterized protein n=1 Tax=Phytophthora rubi TaxID=129364 RepID=A0A6A3MR43_9STRA|nr:hypothetical protein PR001_g9890 [Phytophthora rubi]